MERVPFYRQNIFLAVTACFLWATAFAGIKIGLQYTTPLQFAGMRFMISGLVILPFCKNIRKDLHLLKQNSGRVLQISLFQTVLLYIFFYEGVARTPAATSAIVVGAGPLFVALLAHFFTTSDRLTLRKIISLVFGFSGIILLAIAKDISADNRTMVLTGILMLVIGNICGSFGNILVSKNKTGISPVFLNAIQIFTGGLVIFILSLFIEGFEFSVKPPAYYISLSWLSIMSATAFSFWFIVLNRPGVKVSEINVWKFIVPVFGAILSWMLIEGEKPQWHTITGMLLIAISILVIFGRIKNGGRP